MFDLRIDAGLARLSLDRPEARNAIPLKGWTELADSVARAAAGGARLLILETAPGGAFCAGADIGDFHAFRDDADARTHFRRTMRHGLDALRNLDIPVIAVVDGACYGAGVALAIACDVRFAGPSATFAITPAKLGISYPQEDIHRLVSLVGPGQAARLLLGAQRIDGAEAARIRLVERFAATDLAAEIAEFARCVTANAPESLALLKRGLALAGRNVAQDEGQDRGFDDLLGSELLAEKILPFRRREA